MSTIEELTRLIEPPDAPVAARGDWRAVEASLGLILPDEYKQVIERFGTGRFYNFLWIYSPFDPTPEWSLAYQVRLCAENLQTYKQEGFRIPFPVYPEPDGLLAFGDTENSNYLNWETKGQQNNWSIVIWDTNYLTAWPFPGLTLLGLLIQLGHHQRPVSPEGELFAENMFEYAGFASMKHDE